jgi:hypothetical protein
MSTLNLKELCPPAYLYFIISMLMFVLSLFQNFGNTDKYNVGIYSCIVPSCIIIFILKFSYILFWTWVLNLICKDGYSSISWFLILFPYILFFILIGLLFLNGY